MKIKIKVEIVDQENIKIEESRQRSDSASSRAEYSWDGCGKCRIGRQVGLSAVVYLECWGMWRIKELQSMAMSKKKESKSNLGQGCDKGIESVS
ncbi:hypothetical protein N7509_012885 [Penicillium cosmopolitanum]|uniref:Uncharacterized protein n=1 Tax=Penicillium cosmopolitanum TaxID=1131564 RepID=A0A9W9VCT0_9EURO|nr:uncharacterized protein N7509_012885 [Penicillium cosmopolitanum]KAJ5375999.1 hypothetical protein N7509_012885 [Penicillium cosmopolitanum]